MGNPCAAGDPNATITATDRSATTQRCSLADHRCQRTSTATAHERDCGDEFAAELNAAAQEFVEQWQRRNERTTGRDEDYRELEEVLSPAGAAEQVGRARIPRRSLRLSPVKSVKGGGRRLTTWAPGVSGEGVSAQAISRCQWAPNVSPPRAPDPGQVGHAVGGVLGRIGVSWPMNGGLFYPFSFYLFLLLSSFQNLV